MIGLVIVTHGKLAEEFLNVAEQISGKQEGIETVCIAEKDNIEEKRQELLKKVRRADGGDGVIVLTDLFGGTPSNIAISVAQDENVEALTGVNLPLLIELLTVRGQTGHDLQTVAQKAQEAGRKYIHAATSLLEQKEVG
ncbi:MAG: PTS sugar transporter subunit IIA [Pseudomonadota bacterium]|jgi:PTS system mannose-specific IIA component|nr:PTS sugar transporter subunit IIA [Pseudomonadota bacterium]QKK04229.1 MAG: PTS sugar transporter subunit IIA [Pseudomonadota bacterium]